MSSIRENVEAYIDTLEHRGYLNGSILVAEKGTILSHRGCGTANLEYDIKAGSRTVYRVGSLTKSFTAAAILQLCEQGLLQLEQTIERFFPAIPHAERITIHQLLTHTAGVASFTSRPDYWFRLMRLPATLDDTIALVTTMSPDFAPGEGYQYSNSGYVLLSKIIECTSGMSYANYIKERIVAPLGLEQTALDNGRTPVNGLANGYTVDKHLQHAEPIDMSVPSGAYGLVSTAMDLYRWMSALRNHEVVGPAWTQKMFSPFLHNYGYGWAVDEILLCGNPHVCCSHFGDINGFASDLVHVPDTDVTVVILSNFNLTPVMKISRDLARIVHGDSDPLEKLQARFGRLGEAVMTDGWDELTGTYLIDGTGAAITIARDHDHLYMTIPKQYGVPYTYALHPVSTGSERIDFVADLLPESISLYKKTCGQPARLTHTNVYGDTITAIQQD